MLSATAFCRAAISARLGREWTGLTTVDGGELFLFRAADGEVVRYADYRGSFAFEGFERPFAELARGDAVLAVGDRVVRPRD